MRIELLFSLLLATSAVADTGIEFSNDVLYQGHHDRWYSNGVRVYHDNFALGMEMYTPRDKRNPGIPVNDRPWDGYTYLEYSKQYWDWEDRKFSFRVGCLGHCSHQDDLQKFVHNDLGLGIDPKGWHTQNPSEPALEIIYEHPFIHVFDSWLGMVRSEVSYGARVGNVQDLGYFQADLRKGYLDDTKSIYGFVGLRGEGRLFNTHLQGRMFHDDTYTVDMIPFVASTWLGVGVEYKSWNLEWIYTYITDETELQNYERHIFGTITIKYIW